MSTSAQAKKYLRYIVEIYYPMSQQFAHKTGTINIQSHGQYF